MLVVLREMHYWQKKQVGAGSDQSADFADYKDNKHQEAVEKKQGAYYRRCVLSLSV